MPPTGVIILDKPEGLTSRTAAARVARLAGANRSGHAGTLDPLATGVLVVCLDRATLLTRFLGAGSKEYLVTALLGVATDTYDTDGEIVSTADASGVKEEDVACAAAGLTGERLQVPPAFSAVKHEGRPLYEYARADIPVSPHARTVEISSIDVLCVGEIAGSVRARLRVKCGPGTYVRSLVNDLGRKIGCLACVSELRRTRSGSFSVEDSMTLDELASGREALESALLSMEDALEDIPGVTVGTVGALGVSQGKPLLREWIAQPDENVSLSAAYQVVDERGCLLAIYGPARPEDDPGVYGRAVRVLRPHDVKAREDETS